MQRWGEQPDTEIVARFQHGELKAFGLAGFGYLRAIEGKVHEAAKVADRIVQQNPSSADALVLAVDVLRMAGKSHEAQTLVRDRASLGGEPLANKSRSSSN